MSLELNQALPDFSVQATSDTTLTKSHFLDIYTILYFYPRDNTPGCTTEGLEFKEKITEFKKLNAQIIGVSMDTMRKHENFKAKHAFPFELISDESAEFCKLFDTYKLKKNYGKEYMGIERSTFIINPEGKLIKAWRKVKVKGHVDEVLATLSELQ